MSRGTMRARMSEREEAHSQNNLRKKRVRPTSQFVQIKDECNLRKRRKIKSEHKLVDRISQFPDEILITILSLLPLKEAASTSVLSRRWRYLWASTMTLSFDALDFEVGNTFRHFTELKRELRDQQSVRYVDWVDHVVEQHRGQNIERFSACFFLDYRFKNSIDKWILFAMERRVQILELQFLAEKCFCVEDYTFPQKLFGISVKKGSALEQFLYSAWENLQYFPILHSCRESIGFKTLKVLRLEHVGVTEEFIEYLLSNSPVLERLSLNAARGLVNLRVVSPSNALKYLVIKYCYDLESIEICDTNIVKFIYRDYDATKLLLRNVPSLVEVSISKHLCRTDSIRLPFTQLSCCLSQLEFLDLDIKGADNNLNGIFPKLENLKHLELVVAPNHQALHHLTYFLKVSPHLQRLVLKLDTRVGAQAGIVAHRETGEMEKAAKHPYLKVVEMAGYRACTCAVELVVHLIENVDALEKIVIDPVRSWRQPSSMDRPIEEVEEEVEGRNHAMEYLKEKVPSTIEFLCM